MMLFYFLTWYFDNILPNVYIIIINKNNNIIKKNRVMEPNNHHSFFYRRSTIQTGLGKKTIRGIELILMITI